MNENTPHFRELGTGPTEVFMNAREQLYKTLFCEISELGHTICYHQVLAYLIKTGSIPCKSNTMRSYLIEICSLCSLIISLVLLRMTSFRRRNGIPSSLPCWCVRRRVFPTLPMITFGSWHDLCEEIRRAYRLSTSIPVSFLCSETNKGSGRVP